MTVVPMRLVRHALLAVLVTVGSAAGGCRKEEQNRPASFKPGVYGGEKLPGLTAAQAKALQDRGFLLR